MFVVSKNICAPKEGLIVFPYQCRRRTAAICANPSGSPRTRNEDSCFVGALDNETLLMVGDGMAYGGLGALASAQAAYSFKNSFLTFDKVDEAGLIKMFLLAQTQVYYPSLLDYSCTTIEAFYRHENEAFFAHLGDSRSYLIRGGEVELLFADQTVGTDEFAKLNSLWQVPSEFSSGGLLPEYYEFTRRERSAQFLLNCAGIKKSGVSFRKEGVLAFFPKLGNNFHKLFRRSVVSPLRFIFRAKFEERLTNLKLDREEKQALFDFYLRNIFMIPQTKRLQLQGGDVVLLCSDGLNYLEWGKFFELCQYLTHFSAELGVKILFEAIGNPSDNITVILYIHQNTP